MTAEQGEDIERAPEVAGPAALPGAIESIYMTPPQVQAFLRLVESAPEVNRRSQFYVWMQTHVCVLLPHDLAVCGSYSRQKRQVEFEVFNTIVLPPELLASLTGVDSPLMAEVSRSWVQNGGRPRAWSLEGLTLQQHGIDGSALLRAGLGHIAVHGVARPERPHEIETLFLLSARSGVPLRALLPTFELLVPHLHATYLRSRIVERDLARLAARVPAPAGLERRAEKVTAREAQILAWVREGKSNHEIGEVLGISGLTVKNHVQKILRKLGAGNRAQAVAIAIESRLIAASGSPDDAPPAGAGGRA